MNSNKKSSFITKIAVITFNLFLANIGKTSYKYSLEKNVIN